jgi:hypothetical protein
VFIIVLLFRAVKLTEVIRIKLDFYNTDLFYLEFQ